MDRYDSSLSVRVWSVCDLGNIRLNQITPGSGLPLFTELPRETVWKSEWGRAMVYAPGHGKVLPNRSIRCRMGVSEAPCSGSQQARTTENPQHPRGGPQRRLLLRPEERLPLEAIAP